MARIKPRARKKRRRRLIPLEEFWREHLRPYQREAVEAAFKFWAKKILSLLISLPTGSGKTRVFSYILRKLVEGTGKRVLILAMSETLLQQAEKEIHEKVWPGADTGMVIQRRLEFGAQIIIASVQTLVNHLEELPPIDLVISDEAHHSVCDTMMAIYNHIGSINPTFLHLGLTATPVRSKRSESLSDVYEEICYSASLFRLIAEGYLCPIDGYAVKTTLDLSGVGVEYGDYRENELSEAVLRSNYNQVVVDTYIKKAKKRKALCFAINREQGKALTDLFIKKGIKARYIDYTMKKQKAQILGDFRKKRFQVLVNVALFSEGFNDEGIECILIARPTKSLGFYTQMIGRGTRLHKGKQNCLILDFREQDSGRSGLITLKDLFAFYNLRSLPKILKDYATEERPLSITPETVAEFMLLDEIGEAADRSGALSKLDLIDIKNYAWTSMDGNYYVSLRKDISLVVRQHIDDTDSNKYDVFICSSKKDNRWYAPLTPQPVSYETAMVLCNSHLFEFGDTTFAGNNIAWRDRLPTESQRKGLLSFFYPAYRKIVGPSSVVPVDLKTSGEYAGFINAALSLLAIQEGQAHDRSEVLELVKKTVSDQATDGRVSSASVSDDDCASINLNVQGTYTEQDILKLKKFALMLRFLRGSRFPYEFIVNARILLTPDAVLLRQGAYPRNPLTEEQKALLIKKMRQLFRVNFDKHKLEIDSEETVTAMVA